MKPLRITLFVIVFVVLASQTFRHAYVRWLEPRTSVLDKYNTQTEKQITSARSLEDLVALYDAAHTKLAEYEKAHPEEAGKQAYQRTGESARLSNDKSSVEGAIAEWERKSKEVRELWHFWSAGFIAFAIGSLMLLKYDRWTGMALMILAFAEMIWATSPSFRTIGSQPEFDRLLNQKFLLSIVSLVLLLLAWFYGNRAEAKHSV